MIGAPRRNVGARTQQTNTPRTRFSQQLDHRAWSDRASHHCERTPQGQSYILSISFPVSLRTCGEAAYWAHDARESPGKYKSDCASESRAVLPPCPPRWMPANHRAEREKYVVRLFRVEHEKEAIRTRLKESSNTSRVCKIQIIRSLTRCSRQLTRNEFRCTSCLSRLIYVQTRRSASIG